MPIEELILNKIKKQGKIRTVEIIKETGFSRAYLNRFFQKLSQEGKIIAITQGRGSYYILADKDQVNKIKHNKKQYNIELKNKDLSEDVVLKRIKTDTGIFLDLNSEMLKILDYAFTEMLNNAIDHSDSEKIKIKFSRAEDLIRFEIRDWGIGIFDNIIKKRKLLNELEAIQDLLKGKTTTAPEKHSGEGIFFTSKLGDNFIIQSGGKKITFNNLLEDFFIQDIKQFQGTKVIFVINLNAKQKIANIFKEYSGEGFLFDKTRVVVRLYKMGESYMSRSQARRVVSGLDKFKTIILDYENVDSIGQAFVDEVYRVWQNNHDDKKIITKNANENIKFMINRGI